MRRARALVPARARQSLRGAVDRVGWWGLQRVPRADLEARAKESWRDSTPTSELTWAVELTGDAFIRKAWEHGAGGAVLEIGPGYGRLPEAAIRLGKPFRRWVGLDISPSNVAHLRERFADERLEFIEGDAETFELGGRFDAIVSSLTLKHIFPTFERALANAAASLADGGVVVIDLIEGGYMRHFEPQRGNFIRAYNRDEVEEILGRCGLRVERFDYVDHSPEPEHRRLLVVGRRA